MDRNRLAVIVLFFWGGLQSFWLFSDRLIRDGDEEGHVGAAELFQGILLEQGFFSWVFQGWQGNFGEYPPLFASLLGAWWALFPFPPEHILIRSFGSLFVFLTACFIARIVKRYQGNWFLAFSTVLLLPLFNGVGRHFMPEILLSCLTAGFAMALLEESKDPSWKNKLLIGIFGGFGLLAKQSFLLMAPLILLGFFLSKQLSLKSIFLPILLTLGIASPWYAQQFTAQNQYIQNSIQAKMSIDWLAHGLFYPSTIILIGWGICGSGLLIFLLFRKKERSLPLWSIIWGVGGLLILILLPKKYPRFLLPWLPIIGVWLGLLGKGLSSRTSLIFITLLLAQFIGLSFFPHFSLPFQSKIDDGCPQYWLRPPSSSDFQLERVLKIIEKHPQKSIGVLGDATIDCNIQSTHNWNVHLEPYLRRNGLNPRLEFIEYESKDKNSIWTESQIQIQWRKTIATDNPDDLLIIIRD